MCVYGFDTVISCSPLMLVLFEKRMLGFSKCPYEVYETIDFFILQQYTLH